VILIFDCHNFPFEFVEVDNNISQVTIWKRNKVERKKNFCESLTFDPNIFGHVFPLTNLDKFFFSPSVNLIEICCQKILKVVHVSPLRNTYSYLCKYSIDLMGAFLLSK